jgi:hypothetical protein
MALKAIPTNQNDMSEAQKDNKPMCLNAPCSPLSKEWELALGTQNPHTKTFKCEEHSPPKHDTLSRLTPTEVQHAE